LSVLFSIRFDLAIVVSEIKTLYLCNSKSYNKYVGILQTGIFQRNSTEKNCIQSRLTINKKVCIVGAGSYW
jgi:hypothetical protein